MINPYWIEDKDLKEGKIDHIGTPEVTFWQELIKKYLYPLDADKKEKEKIEQSLKDLRDKMVLAFFMLNALFVTVLFLLQLNKDTIYMNWPLGAKTNISYDQYTLEVSIFPVGTLPLPSNCDVERPWLIVSGCARSSEFKSSNS